MFSMWLKIQFLWSAGAAALCTPLLLLLALLTHRLSFALAGIGVVLHTVLLNGLNLAFQTHFHANWLELCVFIGILQWYRLSQCPHGGMHWRLIPRLKGVWLLSSATGISVALRAWMPVWWRLGVSLLLPCVSASFFFALVTSAMVDRWLCRWDERGTLKYLGLFHDWHINRLLSTCGSPHGPGLANVNPRPGRKALFQALESQTFDVIVVGGGITGAGVALDAALRGYRVALLDKSDFAYGTSSRSSRLAHAGLRYLAQKEFALVHRAAAERQLLLEKLPHLTEPLRFVIPLYSDKSLHKKKIRLALFMYDLLALWRCPGRHRFHSIRAAFSHLLLPSMTRRKCLQGVGEYWDASINDARATLELVLTAEQHGATVINHARAEGVVEIGNDHRFEVSVCDCSPNAGVDGDGPVYRATARSMVFATGAWSGGVSTSLLHAPDVKLQPSKGIHIIVPRFIPVAQADRNDGCPESAVVFTSPQDNRVMFVLPLSSKYNLVGTTDTALSHDDDASQGQDARAVRNAPLEEAREQEAALDGVGVGQDDVEYVLNALEETFPGAVQRDAVVGGFAGVRPLVKSKSGAKGSYHASRAWTLQPAAHNERLFFITGGKLTLYRRMAKATMESVQRVIGPARTNVQNICLTAQAPLHGWPQVHTTPAEYCAWRRETADRLQETHGIDEDIALNLTRYGVHCDTVCELAAQQPRKAGWKRLVPESMTIQAEVDYHVLYEYAVTVTDVVARRTTLLLDQPDQGLAAAKAVAKRMARLLHWSTARIDEELREYYEQLQWHPEH